MSERKRPRRHLVRYRLRRPHAIAQIDERSPHEDDDLAYFVFDFDNDVLAADKPRVRFTSIGTLVRRPTVLTGIPRTGPWRHWRATTATFSRLLHFGRDLHLDSFVLERLEKMGWKARGTLHVDKKCSAYVPYYPSSPQQAARICQSFHEALATAMEVEKDSVREFLWGLGEAVVLGFAASVSAVLFPIVLAITTLLLPTTIDLPASILVICLITSLLVAGAWFFFKLRRDNQALYGAIELGVGFGMAAVSAHGATKGTHLFFVLQAMAAIYVLIRGMVNLTEGRAKKQASARNYLAKKALERDQELQQYSKALPIDSQSGGAS